MSKKPPYPFVKWVGGKARLVPRIVEKLPEKINTYYEPLVGAGAVFIHLAKSKRFEKAVISDVNGEMIIAWRVIRSDLNSLLDCLSNKDYFFYDKEQFLKIRAVDISTLDDVEKTARFIYLNKTCFNGLYRVNKSGVFNTPFGKYKNPLICDRKNLQELHLLLNEYEIEIIKSDFESILDKPKPGDAVYIDPPYHPISDTSNFTSYTSSGFTEEDQKRLANKFGELVKKRIDVVLSNSSAPLIMELYKSFDKEEILGSRTVGGSTDYRKSVTELIISRGNYGKIITS